MKPEIKTRERNADNSITTIYENGSTVTEYPADFDHEADLKRLINTVNGIENEPVEDNRILDVDTEVNSDSYFCPF